MYSQLCADVLRGTEKIKEIEGVTGKDLHDQYESFMRAAWILGVPFDSKGKTRQIHPRLWDASAEQTTWDRAAVKLDGCEMVGDEDARIAVAGARETMRLIVNLRSLRAMYGEITPAKVKEFKHRAGMALTAMANKVAMNEDIRFVANLGVNLL